MVRPFAFRVSTTLVVALLLAGVAGVLVAATVYWPVVARVADLLWLVSGFLSVASLSQISGVWRIWTGTAAQPSREPRPLGAGDVSIAYRLNRIGVGDEDGDEEGEDWVMVEYSVSFAVRNDSLVPTFTTLPFQFSPEPGVVGWGRPRITALRVGGQAIDDRELAFHAERLSESSADVLRWPLSLGANEEVRVVLAARWLKRTASIEPWFFPLPVYGDVTIQVFAAPGLAVDVSGVAGGRIDRIDDSPTGNVTTLAGPFPAGVSALLSWHERPRLSR